MIYKNIYWFFFTYFSLSFIFLFDISNAQEQKENNRRGSTYEDGLSIATYNLMLLPSGLYPNYAQQIRANLAADSEFFKYQDVIVFEELFDTNAATEMLNKLKPMFPYQTPIVGSTKVDWNATTGAWSPFTPYNGGVAIISKWPIVEKSQHIYKYACGADYFSLKGFAYAKIKYNNTFYNIIGTHLQADDNGCLGSYTKGILGRKIDLTEMVNFVNEKKFPKEEYVIYAGDMNIDTDNKIEYNDMINILNVRPPIYVGVPFSADNKRNGIGFERYPTYKSENLDHILVSKNHRKMPQWFNLKYDNQSLSQWKVKTKGRYWSYTDISDHYPLMAFSYATEKTPKHSFAPINGNYYKITLKELKSNKYIAYDDDYKNKKIYLDNKTNSNYITFNLSNNFSMIDNGCILSGDLVKLELSQFPGYIVSDYLIPSNAVDNKTFSALSNLKALFEKSDANKCLSNNDIVTIKQNDNFLFSSGENEKFLLNMHSEELPSYYDWSSSLIYRN
ncbi:sphingomyelin phosphodiesterase [Silvanigrella aquatica]|uniref:Sphingomyelin phosphodiesterase n=1 Tax=Silvanigrella aquatica TaxID=1915309 RepID=A0A1L4D0H9_9BACT|nr:sphingomyelin phosphodiesterase [Silvanigrella aquatica]APJ03706.1 sphingomyelin phosphodiesterase [Silvanigrella aquatica]